MLFHTKDIVSNQHIIKLHKKKWSYFCFISQQNQFSSTTGIQEDSIKEHSHVYNDAHTHTLKVIDYNNTNKEYNSRLSNNNSEVEFLLITNSSEGEHTHGKTGYTATDGNHKHTSAFVYGGGSIRGGQVLDTSNINNGGYEGTGLSSYPIISSNGSSHRHSIPKDGSTHKHSINTKIILYRSGSENDKTYDYGTTETRPKNRLIKIWRRTL